MRYFDSLPNEPVRREFAICPNGRGRWLAVEADGLLGGVFVSRKEGERFALHEADDDPVRVHVVTAAEIRNTEGQVAPRYQAAQSRRQTHWPAANVWARPSPRAEMYQKHHRHHPPGAANYTSPGDIAAFYRDCPETKRFVSTHGG
jgi:hypothetical protein